MSEESEPKAVRMSDMMEGPVFGPIGLRVQLLKQ